MEKNIKERKKLKKDTEESRVEDRYHERRPIRQLVRNKSKIRCIPRKINHHCKKRARQKRKTNRNYGRIEEQNPGIPQTPVLTTLPQLRITIADEDLKYST